MVRSLIFAGALALLPSTPTLAAGGPIQTGNDLFTECDSKDEVRQLSCLAWVAGFVQGFEIAQTSAGVAAICLPQGSTVSQYRDVIVALLSNRPEIRHMRIDAISVSALVKAFPCKAPN